MVPPVTHPLPPSCCSADFPFHVQTPAISFEELHCELTFTRFTPGDFRPFFPDITAISKSDTAIWSACMYSQVADNRRFLYGLLISPLKSLMKIQKDADLTRRILWLHTNNYSKCSFFLPHCDNLVHSLLLIVKKKKMQRKHYLHQFSPNHSSFFLHPLIIPHLIMCLSSPFL